MNPTTAVPPIMGMGDMLKSQLITLTAIDKENSSIMMVIMGMLLLTLVERAFVVLPNIFASFMNMMTYYIQSRGRQVITPLGI